MLVESYGEPIRTRCFVLLHSFERMCNSVSVLFAFKVFLSCRIASCTGAGNCHVYVSSLFLPCIGACSIAGMSRLSVLFLLMFHPVCLLRCLFCSMACTVCWVSLL